MPNNNNSWEQDRALVLSKLDDYGENQKELFKKVGTISESVAILKVKLGYIVASASIIISTIVSVGLKFIG